MSFVISVVEFPAKKLVGMKVRTNMQNAATDCTGLWQTFGPKSDKLTGGACADQSGYGLSVMINENDFDYWAALEISPATKALKGMETMNIPAGLYAKCSVPGLAKLGEAYTYLYGPWCNEQSEYAFDLQGTSFELYPAHWNPADDGGLEIYAAVKKI